MSELEQSQKDIIKSINTQVESLKKSCDYINSMNAYIKENAFTGLDEKSYRNNLREIAVKKSKLVPLLQEHFAFWNEHAPESVKKQLFTVVHDNQLVISPKEIATLAQKEIPIIPHGYSIIEKTYTLSSQYSPDIASSISAVISKTLHDLGQNHLKVQENGKHIVQAMDKNWDSKQALFQILSKNLGDKYDDVWQEFKRAVQTNELNGDAQESKFVILHAKSLGKEQQIKFNVDEKFHITDLEFIPSLKNSISQIRDKAIQPLTEPTIRHIV